MKYLLVLFTALIVSSCYTVPPPVYTTGGDQRCSKDLDCPEHYYCGFKHVDTAPVCKWGGWDYDHWQSK